VNQSLKCLKLICINESQFRHFINFRHFRHFRYFRHFKLQAIQTAFILLILKSKHNKRVMPVTGNVSFTYTEYEKPEELEAEDQELIKAAKKAAVNAYAPYSGFRVGAALRLESGRVVTGSNVENAAFPSGICAERTAIFWSVSNYPDDKPVALAITAMNNEGIVAEEISPCGNCRQVIAEEEMRTGSKIRIILSGRNKIVKVDDGNSLLPLLFGK
jgi:cytidine deaminase